MFERIVVGTDGSPTARQAVEVAIELAELFGASLHIACGYRPTSAAGGISIADAPLGALPSDEEIREMLLRTIEEQVESARAAGLAYEIHLVAGNGASAVLGVAETQKADLIVVGSRGMSGVRRVLGSVPNNVAHHAQASVLIVDTD